MSYAAPYGRDSPSRSVAGPAATGAASRSELDARMWKSPPAALTKPRFVPLCMIDEACEQVPLLFAFAPPGLPLTRLSASTLPVAVKPAMLQNRPPDEPVDFVLLPTTVLKSTRLFAPDGVEM